MSSIDPAAVMFEHSLDPSQWAEGPRCWSCVRSWPCELYRLAEALATEPDRTRAAIVKVLLDLANDYEAARLSSLPAVRKAHAIENGVNY